MLCRAVFDNRSCNKISPQIIFDVPSPPWRPVFAEGSSRWLWKLGSWNFTLVYTLGVSQVQQKAWLPTTINTPFNKMFLERATRGENNTIAGRYHELPNEICSHTSYCLPGDQQSRWRLSIFHQLGTNKPKHQFQRRQKLPEPLPLPPPRRQLHIATKKRVGRQNLDFLLIPINEIPLKWPSPSFRTNIIGPTRHVFLLLSLLRRRQKSLFPRQNRRCLDSSHPPRPSLSTSFFSEIISTYRASLSPRALQRFNSNGAQHNLGPASRLSSRTTISIILSFGGVRSGLAPRVPCD